MNKMWTVGKYAWYGSLQKKKKEKIIWRCKRKWPFSLVVHFFLLFFVSQNLIQLIWVLFIKFWWQLVINTSEWVHVICRVCWIFRGCYFLMDIYFKSKSYNWLTQKVYFVFAWISSRIVFGWVETPSLNFVYIKSYLTVTCTIRCTLDTI